MIHVTVFSFLCWFCLFEQFVFLETFCLHTLCFYKHFVCTLCVFINVLCTQVSLEKEILISVRLPD